MKHWSNYFAKRDACKDALVGVEKYPTFQSWWDDCQRADWMLWGLSRLNPVPIEFWKSVVMCARSVLPNFESVFPDDNRPRKAIETRERWILDPNSVTDIELESVRLAARLAARSAAWSARSARSAARSAAESARSAAWSAAESARSAAWSAAESAAWSARSARSAAWSAAESAAWSAVESATLKELADKIREIMPKVPEVESEVYHLKETP